MKFKRNQGFTLIELLVVIVIIGILATLATISLGKMREKANDTKRVSDVKQIQHALDMYANDQGVYPVFGTALGQFSPGYPLTSPDGSVTYMKKIPNHGKNTGSCAQAEYIYAQGVGGLSYTLTYCIGNPVYEISAGTCLARPGIICSPQLACANNDITRNCCTDAVVGNVCGGGTVYFVNYSGANYKLIVYQPNQILVNAYYWDNNGSYNITGATNMSDGVDNINKLTTADFEAVQVCNNTVNTFDDWYLPSANELRAFATSTVASGAGGFTAGWTSTEDSQFYAYAISGLPPLPSSRLKNMTWRTYCIRRQ